MARLRAQKSAGARLSGAYCGVLGLARVPKVVAATGRSSTRNNGGGDGKGCSCEGRGGGSSVDREA
eukprot:305073-Pleurochrysis_carterae.AAC.1